MVALLTRFFGAKRNFREGLQVWPFALFAGVAFTLPYYLVARLLGPEFYLFGSLSGAPDRGASCQGMARSQVSLGVSGSGKMG